MPSTEGRPHQAYCPEADDVKLHPLNTHAEYEAAVFLQQQIWGDDVREIVPVGVLQICQEVGGIAVGAFDSTDHLVGFVFGITGPRNGKLVHWSHILAVEESWRDRGIGRRLKQCQRSMLEELNVAAMMWTFDPLETRNAHLNLSRLGAVVEQYVPDLYGKNPVAATDTVIGSDRFVVCWNFGHVVQTRPLDQGELAAIPLVSALPLPTLEGFEPDPPLVSDPTVRIEIPPAIQALKQRSPDQARVWRESTRRAFTHYLENGYVVTSFQSVPGSGNGCYLLSQSQQSTRTAPDGESQGAKAGKATRK